MSVSRRALLTFVVAAPFATTFALPAMAAESAVYNNDGIAVDGSDVVAYFTENKPVAGSAEFSHDWNGVTWLFASAANRDTFAANPEAYAPQYGGYCSWAVAEGYTASTTPEAWAVVDGKLYLNYSKRIQRRWERDIPGFIATANENWPKVLN